MSAGCADGGVGGGVAWIYTRTESGLRESSGRYFPKWHVELEARARLEHPLASCNKQDMALTEGWTALDLSSTRRAGFDG